MFLSGILLTITFLGEPMNVNEAGLDFRLDEDDSNEVILRLFLPKFLDTQLIDVDAQPKYVRVKVKGKSFQVVFRSGIQGPKGRLCAYYGTVRESLLQIRSQTR